MRFLFVLALSVFVYTPTAMPCAGVDCASACKLGEAPAPVDLSKLKGDRASFTVTGMKCGKCSSKVVVALNAVSGVKGSIVDHATGKAQVVFEAAKTDSKALLAAINSTGYTATLDKAAK